MSIERKKLKTDKQIYDQARKDVSSMQASGVFSTGYYLLLVRQKVNELRAKGRILK